MAEKPILFSGEMVRAILEGRKTMTRRVIKPQPHHLTGRAGGRYIGDPLTEDGKIIHCPYGQPGGRLWVRETWRVGAWREDDQLIAADYRADGYARREWLHVEDKDYFEKLWEQSTQDASAALGIQENYKWEPGASPCRWRPSIFMPRWASRILLEVTVVRVERLQDISEEDAKAEGVTRLAMSKALNIPGTWIGAFADLWDSINAKCGYGWGANPWVRVVSFKPAPKAKE
jgi:hypothetical protein